MAIKTDDPAAESETQFAKSSGLAWLAVFFLVLCCAVLPLVLVSGVSLALVSRWPVIGAIVAVLGAIGLVWYWRKRC
ncbi:hypothetical protein OVY48_06210 [Sphingobium sp. SA2]|uniref:hypothetical protein n=1 Tax=Sphingobium sp. SA2 TaxID=1524832 RepID=UPI0028BF6E17|nr:hypothetical protein [Sphingobium sp. SA2]MDT7533031.1 hypothetical protein [Sphingobium sp. SA2]